MNRKVKPLAWIAATAGSAYLLDIGAAKFIADNIPYIRDHLPLAVKQPGLNIAINSLMSYSTLRSAVKNWVPDVSYRRVFHIYRKTVERARSKKVAMAAALALGNMITFSTDTAYLYRKAKRGELPDGMRTLYRRATCLEPRRTLDELIEQHGQYHKEALKSKRYSKDPAKRYRIDPRLALAMESVESDGIWCAVSKSYARGPTQLVDGTARKYRVSDPFNAKENIRGGDNFLADVYFKYKGNARPALAAYNWGPINVDSGSKWPKDVTAYVNEVLRRYEILKSRYNYDLEWSEQIKKPPIKIPSKPAAPRKRAMIHLEFQTGHMPAYIPRNHSYQRL